MISLHSNTVETDAYDSVQDTGDELNVLINKANRWKRFWRTEGRKSIIKRTFIHSLGYYHNQLQPSEDIYQKTKPKEKKLDSKHPEAFAKIIAPISSKVRTNYISSHNLISFKGAHVIEMISLSLVMSSFVPQTTLCENMIGNVKRCDHKQLY